MEKDAFIMQLRQMIEIKDKIGEMLLTVDCCPNNSLLESLFHGIGLDAKKHSEMFKGLMDRAQGINKAVEEERRVAIIDTLSKVLELEWNMKTQVRNVIDIITDEKTKKVLTTILGDIQRHEVVLGDLKEFVDSMTVEEEKVLDKIWKYSIKFDDSDEEA